MNELELEVWQRVAGFAQSPSHDFRHIKRVQEYADQLGKVLGVDTELVRLAAILHDLGRSDESRRHGLSSIEASKEMAEEVLRHLDLSDEARKTVVEAIETHDQPDLSPENTASRILKDADFLAGFGAWGVLRIAMWSGETGRRIDDVIQRMTAAMQRRIENLEFSVSRDAALREVLFARQFQAELDRPARITTRRYEGYYVVLEGISGVGKNTIADAVCDKLTARGIPNSLVEEPGDLFRILRDELNRKEGVSDADSVPLKKALLMADRAVQFEKLVRPKLEKGDVVVSVRSYMSTAVYQSCDLAEAYRILIDHDWLPLCDLLVLLDTDADTALARIRNRSKTSGQFETVAQLKVHRELYRELATSFPSRHTAIVDASGTVAGVVENVHSVLTQHLELSGG